MASLHPTHGARIVLERERTGAREAIYRVSVYEPEVAHEGTAHLRWDPPEVSFAWSDGDPPEWASVFLERLFKGMPKKHGADASWPRKITRWREPR